MKHASSGRRHSKRARVRARRMTLLAAAALVVCVGAGFAIKQVLPTGGSTSTAAPGSSPASSAASQPDAEALAASAAAAEKAAKAAAAQAQLDDPLMVLVSPVSPMPESYVVGDTVTCSTDVNNGTLAKVAGDAYKAMKEAAAADGITLHLQSGYRSVDYQANLFKKQIEKWKNTGLDEAAATEKAKTVVTPPGCSEHNCGLAADINSPEYYPLEEPFKNTKAYAWLCAHAEEYGFILRYPQDKEEITGIIYEPWHWRYVGVENAKAINASGLCLEEYVAQLKLDAAL